jgi:hypothetical protein
VISAKHSLLTAFAAQGVTISGTPAGGLRVGGPREVVAKLTPRIRAAKLDLLAELTGQTREEQAGIDAIEERAALAADSVPGCYLTAWARLNCQKPTSVSEAEWRLALDDGGRFLDAWGADAATMRWTAGELFDVPRNRGTGGLIWLLAGERVTALGEDRARLADGRTIKRSVS